VVSVDVNDELQILVQHYTNAGAKSGAALSFTGGYPGATVVDAEGDIVVQFDDATSGDPEWLFIPDGATSSSDAGVIPEVANPNDMEITTDSSGGFVGFVFNAGDLDSQTISTRGALGSELGLGSVGASIYSDDFPWSAVTLSGGRYAVTLAPDSSDQTGYPATDQVIEVSSLTASSTTIEDLTTSGGGSALVGPWAVADGSGGIATYTDVPETPSDISAAGYPLDASLTAATYLDAAGPTVSAGGTTTFTAGGPSVVLDVAAGVTDPSSTTLNSATVTIASGLRSGDELSATTAGTSITAAYNATTGALSLTGLDTLAHFDSVLDSVSYNFDASDGDPTTGGTDNSRTISWQVNDGTTTSPAATSTLDVALQSQAALTLTSTSGTYGTALTLATSGGSGAGTVSYTATNGTASGCTVSGSSLSVTSAGTCSVTATKAADSTYSEVSSDATSVTFAKATQAALTLTSTSGTYGTPLTLTTSGGSGTGTVAYAVADGTATGCLVSGTTLTASSLGTCSVTATKATDVDYLQISSSPTTVTLAGQTQAALTLTSTSGTYGSTLTLTTSGGSGAGTVSYTATNGTASGCTVSGSSLSVTSAGTCSVTASKAGDSSYSEVSSDATSVTFAKATQAALTVTSTSGTYGAALTLTTSGGSGTGTVSYGAVDGTASGCTVSGSSLSVTSAGTCSVIATKATDADYLVASSDATTVTFAQATQATLTVTSTSGTYGATLTLTTSGGSGSGSVSYMATNGTATGCTVSGSSLSVTSAGTCMVTATKAADGDYDAASSDPVTVTFGKASQTVAFSSTAPSGAVVGTTYEPAASASSGLSVVIVVDASSAGCSITSGVVHFTGSGVCVLDATQPGDANWLAAVQATQKITVAAAPQTITVAAAPQTITVAVPTTGTTTTTTTTNPTKPRRNPPRKRKHKRKPEPKQRLTVRISGLRPGATYFGNVPAPRCVTSTNVGHVVCRITRRVTSTKPGTKVTYTAHARGSAGAEATARLTVHTAKLELVGLHTTHGLYVVKLGNYYTLRVASRTKPRYVDAAVAPHPPAGTHDWFHRAGSIHGIPVWTLRVYLPSDLSLYPSWNIGIRIGNRTQIITIRT
jgi:hypothetical protein